MPVPVNCPQRTGEFRIILPATKCPFQVREHVHANFDFNLFAVGQLWVPFEFDGPSVYFSPQYHTHPSSLCFGNMLAKTAGERKAAPSPHLTDVYAPRERRPVISPVPRQSPPSPTRMGVRG